MRLHADDVSDSDKNVSIHASVKDATDFETGQFYSIISFNPRICKRCDTFKIIFTRTIIVSIHASVKDATLLLGVNG